MGSLIDAAIVSVDGDVAGQSGWFDRAAPDNAMRRFINDLEQPGGTDLSGRRRPAAPTRDQGWARRERRRSMGRAGYR